MTLALILYIAINARLLKHATLGKKAQASSHCEVIKSSVDCNSSIELKYYSRRLEEDVLPLPLMLFFFFVRAGLISCCWSDYYSDKETL